MKDSAVRRLLLLVPAAALLAGCDGIQAVFEPAGPRATEIARLGWLLFIGAALIFLFVMALAGYVVFARSDRRHRLASSRLVIGGGIVFPVVTLTALIVYELLLADELTIASETASEPAALRIEVIGEQWWWRVHYLDEAGAPDVITANEIHIPIGRPVEFVLKTADVIHSFWVPQLAGKLDMIPGRTNSFVVQADRPGVYRGQCAEYCGGAHALMAFFVVAETPESFAAWMARQRQPAAEPATPVLARGRALFLSSGCGACHRVRGLPAEGVVGPDLTHVGSRLSLAAGIFPNNVGTIAGWIADSQHLKPDNEMPSFAIFEGEELRALAAFLESLK